MPQDIEKISIMNEGNDDVLANLAGASNVSELIEDLKVQGVSGVGELKDKSGL